MTELNNIDKQSLLDIFHFRNAVGALAYLADTSGLDIAYATNQLAQKMGSTTTSD